MVSKKRLKIKFNGWFFLFGTIVTVFLFKSWQLYIYDKSFNGKIYPNVYIDNQSFAGKSKKQVVDYFVNKSSPLDKVLLTLEFENQPVATFSGKQLNINFDGQTAAERAYMVGRSKFFLSRFYQKLAIFFNIQKYDFITTLNFDRSLVSERITDLKDIYDKPAKNALFKFENGRVSSFRKEEIGQEIITDSVLNDIDNVIQAFRDEVKNSKIKINSVVIKPDITLSSINDFGIEELIAEGSSDFTHSIPQRIHNVLLAASKFNGVLIPPGKIFSFNDAVGDISSLTGYQPAYIIKEGKTVLGDGGGVCQVSTTLFRAALNAGLPIVERNAHAYRVSYYENDRGPGFDATVFAPSVDLKIKNDTTAYILIETNADEENNLLFFKLYGKKDNRKIEVSKSTVWDVVPPPEPKYQEDPTLKKGTVKQVDFPAWGSKAIFSYKVYKNNNLNIDEKFYSNYRPWQAVYMVGTAD